MVKKIYGFFFGYCNHDIYGAKKLICFHFQVQNEWTCVWLCVLIMLIFENLGWVLMFGKWVSARRSSLGLKLALVTLHLIYAGILFLFDGDLIEKTKQEPWYVRLLVSFFLKIQIWSWVLEILFYA